jgi:hypothetical protein
VIVAAFDSTARFVWSRNRWILLGCAAAYVAIFIACQIWSPDQIHRSLPQTTIFMRLAPFFVPILVLVGSVNVATAQLGGRESFFPRLFYTLPIKAHEMVMPFITYCVALTAAMWLAGGIISGWRILMLAPPGTPIEAETISYWLPFLITSGLVWFQVLAWTPVAFGWIRICAFFAATLAHFFAVFLCAVGTVTPNQVVIASLLQIPLAFVIATRSVARARWDVSHDDARGRSARNDKSAARAERRPLRNFSGALDAQSWFEHRVQRWSGVVISALPLLLLVILVVLNAINGRIGNPELFGIVARIAITVFLWSLIALGAANGYLYASFRSVTRWQYKDVFAMPSFFAALPMPTGDFVWVKLTSVMTRMLWFSGAAVLACGWITLSAGLIDFDSGKMLALRQQHGDFAAATTLVIAVCAFVLFLLSCTANMMSLSLGGRARNWLSALNLTRYLAFAFGAAAVGIYWGRHRAPPPGLAEIVRALAILKLVTLTLLVRHVGRSRLLGWGRLAIMLVFWLATFGALLDSALAFLSEGQISGLTLAACLVLLTPVQGTIAAPLALHLNRVR